MPDTRKPRIYRSISGNWAIEFGEYRAFTYYVTTWRHALEFALLSLTDIHHA